MDKEREITLLIFSSLFCFEEVVFLPSSSPHLHIKEGAGSSLRRRAF
jgi:hypothetical protein